MLPSTNRSDDWEYVSEEEKERVGMADEDNGIWWMPYGDFVANFSDATICSIGPDFDEDGDPTGDRWASRIVMFYLKSFDGVSLDLSVVDDAPEIRFLLHKG